MGAGEVAAILFGVFGLLDPAGGYARGAEIAFLDLELRRYQDGGDVALEALTLVEIQSVVPRDRVFRPVSWRLGAGFERLREEDGDAVGDLAFALRGGGGPSFEPADGVLVSGFAEAALYAPEFAPEDWRLGLGPRLGLLWSATPRWRLHLDGHIELLLGGDEEFGDRWSQALRQSFEVRRDLALRLDAAVKDDGDGAFAEITSGLHWYF